MKYNCMLEDCLKHEATPICPTDAVNMIHLESPKHNPGTSPSGYFDLLTPAPMTPGSCSSPTLNSKPMANVTAPTIVTVKPVINQNGTLTSSFWHMLPPQ